jgi:hypothetical protein
MSCYSKTYCDELKSNHMYLDIYFKKFYFGLYDLENLVSRIFMKDLLNFLTTSNHVPKNEDFELNIFRINSKLEKNDSGRYGLCTLCSKNADFYCCITRKPICSLICKDKNIVKEFFFNFLWSLKKEMKKVICFENQSNYDYSSFIKLIETIFEYILKELYRLSFKELSKEISKIKLYVKILCEFFTSLNFMVDKFIITNHLNIIVEIIYKLFLFGHNQILKDLFYLLTIIIKNYGYNLKFQLLNLFSGFLKIIKFFFDNEIRLSQFLIFLNNLLTLHEHNFLFFIFDNIDHKEYQIFFIEEVLKIVLEITIGCYSRFINCNEINKNNSKSLDHLQSCSLVFLNNVLKVISDKISGDLIASENKEFINKYALQYKRKRNLVNYCELFNNYKYKDFEAFLSDKEKFDADTQTNYISFFIKYMPEINKSKVGEIFADRSEQNQKLFDEFLKTFNFNGKDIVDSMREFLFSFKLNGESQIIDRIITKFSLKYFTDNKLSQIKLLFDHEDSAYYLSYNIIMLNTNLHNPNVKDKMPLELFIKSLNGLNNGKNFDFEFLVKVYNKIKYEEFAIDDSEYNNIIFDNSVDIHEKQRIMMRIFNLKIKFNLKIEIDDKWILDDSRLLIFSVSMLIIKYFFEFLILKLEVFVQNKITFTKDIIDDFYTFFFKYLKVLDKMGMIQEKISILSIWVKSLDFTCPSDVYPNKIISLKKFYKNIIEMNISFFEIMEKVIFFILSKHEIYENYNGTEDKSPVILDLCKIFAPNNLKIFLKGFFMYESQKLKEICNIFINILIRQLEYTGFLNNFILIQFERFIININKNSELWSHIFTQIEKLLKIIIFEFSKEINVSIMLEFLIKIFNLYQQSDKIILEATFDNIIYFMLSILKFENIITTWKFKIINSLEKEFPKNLLILSTIITHSNIFVYINELIKLYISNEHLIGQLLSLCKIIIHKCQDENIYESTNFKIFKLLIEVFKCNFLVYQSLFQYFLKKNIIPINNDSEIKKISDHLCEITLLAFEEKIVCKNIISIFQSVFYCFDIKKENFKYNLLIKNIFSVINVIIIDEKIKNSSYVEEISSEFFFEIQKNVNYISISTVKKIFDLCLIYFSNIEKYMKFINSFYLFISEIENSINNLNNTEFFSIINYKEKIEFNLLKYEKTLAANIEVTSVHNQDNIERLQLNAKFIKLIGNAGNKKIYCKCLDVLNYFPINSECDSLIEILYQKIFLIHDLYMKHYILEYLNANNLEEIANTKDKNTIMNFFEMIICHLFYSFSLFFSCMASKLEKSRSDFFFQNLENILNLFMIYVDNITKLENYNLINCFILQMKAKILEIFIHKFSFDDYALIANFFGLQNNYEILLKSMLIDNKNYRKILIELLLKLNKF